MLRLRNSDEDFAARHLAAEVLKIISRQKFSAFCSCLETTKRNVEKQPFVNIYLRPTQ